MINGLKKMQSKTIPLLLAKQWWIH